MEIVGGMQYCCWALLFQTDPNSLPSPCPSVSLPTPTLPCASAVWWGTYLLHQAFLSDWWDMYAFPLALLTLTAGLCPKLLFLFVQVLLTNNCILICAELWLTYCLRPGNPPTQLNLMHVYLKVSPNVSTWIYSLRTLTVHTNLISSLETFINFPKLCYSSPSSHEWF